MTFIDYTEITPRSLSKQEEMSFELYTNLKRMVPEQVEKVMIGNEEMCDIEPVFMGFIDTYYYLSILIPKHFTVLDLGCSYAAQCYYFRNHKKYIGVDLGKVDYRFSMPNTEHHMMDLVDYVKTSSFILLNLKQTFAICNYVPPWGKFNSKVSLSKYFPNIYQFYPSMDKNPLFDYMNQKFKEVSNSNKGGKS